MTPLPKAIEDWVKNEFSDEGDAPKNKRYHQERNKMRRQGARAMAEHLMPLVEAAQASVRPRVVYNFGKTDLSDEKQVAAVEAVLKTFPLGIKQALALLGLLEKGGGS